MYCYTRKKFCNLCPFLFCSRPRETNGEVLLNFSEASWETGNNLMQKLKNLTIQTLNFLFIHAFSANWNENSEREFTHFALIKKDHLNNETNLWTFTRKLENKLLYVYFALSALSPAFFVVGFLMYCDSWGCCRRKFLLDYFRSY